MRDGDTAHQSFEGDGGSVLIEFALVFLLFMVLVMGMVDFGLAINSKTQISNGGREAARIGTLGRSPDELEDRVRETTANLDQDNLTVSSTCEEPGGVLCTGDFGPGDVRNGEPGDSVIITVAYTYGVITPIPRMIGLGSNIDLESVTEMRIE
jgi:hypothetical protein